MTLEAFTEEAADYQIFLENLAADKHEEIQRLFLELLEDPEKRAPEIALWFLDSEIGNSVLEYGSEEIAEMIWEPVDELLELSFSELNEIPPDERGDVFDKARQIMVAASLREAMIRSGLFTEALNAGTLAGAMQERTMKGVTRKDIEGGHLIKTKIKERKSEFAKPAFNG